jgi:hypothetical protein
VFRVAKLRFEIELLDDRAPRGYWGSRLRGGFGETLRAQLCVKDDPLKCREGSQACVCSYASFFEPTRERDGQALSGKPLGNQENLPASFVISPPDSSMFFSRKGDRLSFDFVAIAKMCERMTEVVRAFEAYGELGLVRRANSRARFRVNEVFDLLAGGRSIYWQGPIQQPITKTVSAMAAELAAQLQPEHLQVIFKTPVRLKNEKAKLTDPGTGLTVFSDFWDFVYNLANRTAGLWQLYGEEWPGQAEFYRWRDRLLRAARKIETVESDLRMVNLKGYSNRQEKAKPLDGFVGRMQFKGDFTAFRELLAIGEVVHVGSETSAGLGCYRMIFDSSDKNS